MLCALLFLVCSGKYSSNFPRRQVLELHNLTMELRQYDRHRLLTCEPLYVAYFQTKLQMKNRYTLANSKFQNPRFVHQHNADCNTYSKQAHI
jgi:hypothetical protein